MNDEVAIDLQSQIDELRRSTARPRQGVVTATSPLTIKLGGSTDTYASVQRLSSYTPTVADLIEVLMYGNTCIVLGKVV